MQRLTIQKIIRKKNKIPITCLTAYTKDIAEIADKYCDIILVGDSLGMVLYGMKNTRNVKIDTMIAHAKVVRNFTKKSLIVVDMPFKTYTNKFLALKNAKKIIKSTKCHAVKLEGGKEIVNTINYLVKRSIPVMGHIGLLPQSSKNFTLKGKKTSEKKRILKDAIAISNAGVFAMVIECVVEDLAKKISRTVPVPTIGIGASKHCDGQILVTDDMLGLSYRIPKFVKKYSNLRLTIEKGIKEYSKDVKNKKFPYFKNIYR